MTAPARTPFWVCCVDEPADAQRLAPRYPDCHFLLPDGTSYHGAAVTGGRKSASGPLALKRELRERIAAKLREEKAR